MAFKKPEIRRTDKTVLAYKTLPLQDSARRDLRKEGGTGSCWTLPEYYQVHVKEHLPLTTPETAVEVLKVLNTSVSNTILKVLNTSVSDTINLQEHAKEALNCAERQASIQVLLTQFSLASQRHKSLQFDKYVTLG